ncbi:hypothetical protein LAZ67_18001162 [Cordylochernes scorpioides]|uniref:Endonuclease/exonuclease/phosphatase domain-containing protein n=1 Tax=Cordylochernes scorpioides TaxID=51811 RepID=A0ABY6LGF2_9ARAC|nr:hypothetical protein LAZ67_18001162 [Cordylochernes scorpioides]
MFIFENEQFPTALTTMIKYWLITEDLPLPGYISKTAQYNIRAVCKHQSWGCFLNNTEGSILSTFIDDNNLTIVSHGPTYISHSYGTLQKLDLTITSPSMQQFIKNSTLKNIRSDHLSLLTEISTSLLKSSQRLFWNYKKASWNSFKTSIDSLLSKIPLNFSLEDRWKNWKSAVLISAKQNIPRGNRKFYILGYREVLDLLKDEIEDRNQEFTKTLLRTTPSSEITITLLQKLSLRPTKSNRISGLNYALQLTQKLATQNYGDC